MHEYLQPALGLFRLRAVNVARTATIWRSRREQGALAGQRRKQTPTARSGHLRSLNFSRLFFRGTRTWVCQESFNTQAMRYINLMGGGGGWGGVRSGRKVFSGTHGLFITAGKRGTRMWRHRAIGRPSTTKTKSEKSKHFKPWQ